MKVSKLTIINILFAGVVLFLTRQFPLNAYSTIGNIFLIGLLLVSFIGKNRLIDTFAKKTIKVIFFWSIFLLVYALLIRDNSISWVFRFYIIVICLLLSHWICLPFFSTKKIFFFFIVLQCIVLIVFELILNIGFDMKSYLPIRFLFQEQGWGDVYTYDGFFYRIQIKGNALIPFAFFLTFLKDYTFKYRKILQSVLFISSIIIKKLHYR